MLETEIKKLTAALEANTAALLGGSDAKLSGAPTPAGQVETAAIVPQQPAPAGPAVASPIAPPVPASAAPPVAGPTVAPSTPAAPQLAPVAQPMTHQQAQAELTAIVQQLGDGAQVQATMLQYGSAQLNQIPAENLFSLVQACKALRTA